MVVKEQLMDVAVKEARGTVMDVAVNTSQGTGDVSGCAGSPRNR